LPRSEHRYLERAVDWYERTLIEDFPLVRFCSVTCICRRCLQADYNVAYVMSLPLEVLGL
jgi:hypothetical protein